MNTNQHESEQRPFLELLINTLLQRGVRRTSEVRNVFNGLGCVCETVETVSTPVVATGTPLKQGVNERLSRPWSRFCQVSASVSSACLLCVSSAVAQTTKTWIGPSGGSWFNATNWTPAGVPASDDTIVVTNGFVNLTAPVTIAGQFNWSGGALLGNALTIASDGVLNISSASSVTLGNALTNAGTVNWLNGTISPLCAAGFGPIVNLTGALWDIQCDRNLSQACFPGTNNYFLNLGTLRKSASTNMTAVSLPLRNSNTVSVLQGTLRLTGGGPMDGNWDAANGATLQFGIGSYSYTTVPVFTGPGVFQFISGSLTLLDDVIPNLALVGGTIFLGPFFQGGAIASLTLATGMTLAGSNTVSGTFNWAGAIVSGPLLVADGATVNWGGGVASGALTVASGAVLNIASSVTLGNALTNSGTVNWLNGQISPQCTASFGPIVNLAEALWDIQCDQNLIGCGTASNSYFLNLGTFRKSASTNITSLVIPLRNSNTVSVLQGTLRLQGGGAMDGNWDAADGAVILFDIGSYSYTSVPAFAGPGAFQLTRGTLTLLDDLLPNLALVSGTIILGPNFHGGTITNLTLGAGMTLAGSNTVSGTFDLSGATLAGRLFVANGATVNWSAGSAPGGLTIASNGLLNVMAPSTVTSAGALTNDGTVAVLQGTLALTGSFNPAGGTVRFGMSALNNFGKITIAGSATLGGTVGAVWLNGFIPALSNSFAVLTYGSRTGIFTNLDLPPEALWATNYGATMFTLTVVRIDKLVFAPGPAGTNAGAILSPVAVQVQDADSNPVATNGLPITLTLNTGAGPLNGTLTRTTDATGKATFADLSLNVAGVKTLRATASGPATPVISGSFTILPNAATQLVLTTPISSPQPAGASFSPVPVVQMRDRFGNVVPNVTAAITARLSSSSGGGRLGGTTNFTAGGPGGIAFISNLRYNLLNPAAAETVEIYFDSPGLTPATNSPVLIAFVFTNITLQAGNSVVRIDPITQRGLFSCTVDGVQQVHQHWFWLRAGTNTSQTSFDKFGTPWGLAYTTSNAVINYFAQGMSVQAGFTLQGGPPGSQSSELAERISVQNITNTPISLHLFAYSDFDLSNSPYADMVSRLSPQVVVQQGKGMQVTETIHSPTPDHWEAGYYGITLAGLLEPSPLTLADTFIPPAPGDQTFAFQWDTILGAGQSFVVNLANSMGPISGGVPAPTAPPVWLDIALTGTNILLSWPTNGAEGFALQSASALSGERWNTITNRLVVSGEQHQVILPGPVDAQFYRLQK